MAWWKYYGFITNPLDIRPSYELVGLSNIEKTLINSIENGEIILLYGDIGSGKTSLAYKIMRDYSDIYNFIYVNGEIERKTNLIKLVENKKYNKFLFLKFEIKKPIILILDEFYNFDPDVVKQIKYLYDNNLVKSCILIQISDVLENITPSFANRIFKKIEMPKLNSDDIIKIIRNRLKDKIRFNKDFLVSIIVKNNYNVRSVLIELNNILENMKHPIKEEISGINIETKNIEEPELDVEELNLSPQQFKIISVLVGNKLTAKNISELTNIKLSSLTKQLSRLYNMKVILKEEINGNIYYYINPKYLNSIIRKIGK